MMRIRLPALVLLVLGLGFCAAYAAEDYVPPEPLHGMGLTKFWQLQLPLEQGQQVLDAFLVDEMLYFGTNDGFAFAVHAPTGTLRWLRPVTRTGYRVRRPAHAGEHVIFATPTDIQVYQRRNGDPVMRRALEFPGGTGLVCDGRLFFIGGLDKRLYAFGTDDQLLRWRAITSAPISVTPALYQAAADGDAQWSIYTVNESGDLYAAGADDKVQQWMYPLGERVTAELVVGERGVYVAARDMSLYLLDRDHGTLRWRARFASPLQDPPLVANDLVFQYSAADGIGAVDNTTIGVVDERIRWRFANGRAPLTTYGDTLYALTRDGQLAAVRTKDGAVIAAAPTGGLNITIPVADEPVVYLAAADGRVFCARPRGATPPTREDILDALIPKPATQAETAPATQPAKPAPAAQPAATQPDGGAGALLGGKSKISKEFGGGR
ncbi:MAG: PQQ-binding-like beta-propeller repeat protein [Planctomycetota bacterium]